MLLSALCNQIVAIIDQSNASMLFVVTACLALGTAPANQYIMSYKCECNDVHMCVYIDQCHRVYYQAMTMPQSVYY